MILLIGIAAAIVQLSPARPLPDRSSVPALIPAPTLVECAVDPVEQRRILALTPREFDQNGVAGWRGVAQKGCYAEAAKLIEKYAATATDLRLRSALHFHLVQMLAFAGKTKESVAAVDLVDKVDVERNADVGWRLYVAGTKAFLQRRKQDLENYAQELSIFASKHGATERVALLNGNVLEGLIRCFDRSYKSAYGPPCADAGKARTILAPKM